MNHVRWELGLRRENVAGGSSPPPLGLRRWSSAPNPVQEGGVWGLVYILAAKPPRCSGRCPNPPPPPAPPPPPSLATPLDMYVSWMKDLLMAFVLPISKTKKFRKYTTQVCNKILRITMTDIEIRKEATAQGNIFIKC